MLFFFITLNQMSDVLALFHAVQISKISNVRRLTLGESHGQWGKDGQLLFHLLVIHVACLRLVFVGGLLLKKKPTVTIKGTAPQRVKKACLGDRLHDGGIEKLGGFCFARGNVRTTKHGPIHVGPKQFAANTSQLFKPWAVFSGNSGQAPLINDLVAAKVQSPG